MSPIWSRARCLYYDLPSSKIDQLRDLLSLRRRLKKEEHSLRMRIRNSLLAKFFPELDSFYGACESETLAIVKWCLDINKIVGMEFDEFFTLVTRTERGTAQKLRLRKIHRLAVDSVGCPMGPADEFEAKLLVEKLKQVRQEIKEIQEFIEDVSVHFADYTWLLTIPGFGPYVSARVLASVADPWRFDSAKQLLRLSGYDLCASRSGKDSEKAIPKTSKNGNAELRYALYQAAKVGLYSQQAFHSLFQQAASRQRA